MKIAILTQPLGHNYGGILQAFALQKYLIKQGHSVVTIDRRPSRLTVFRALKQEGRVLLNLFKGRIKSRPSNSKRDYVFQELHRFRSEYVSLSRKISSEEDLVTYFEREDFEAVIVGSDQVWRPRYSPCLDNFFLNFLDKIQSKPKRISYAASFGVDHWEFSEQQTVNCKHWLSCFDSVSVRESSAVELCQNKFGINAELVVDPTLLLEALEYKELFTSVEPSKYSDRVLSYVLDPHEDKQKIAVGVGETLRLKTVSIKPNIEYTQVSSGQIQECLYQSVEDWIRSFHDASFVVTDSFHGCVFSIIFNKPFIAVGNPVRGLARFESLLRLFGLENRLVSSIKEVTVEKIRSEIDWSIVNELKLLEITKAKKFLNQSLEGLQN